MMRSKFFLLLVMAAFAGPRIAWAHEVAWARPATPAEIARGTQYIERYSDELRRAGAPTERVEIEAWTSYARVMLTANEFLFVD